MPPDLVLCDHGGARFDSRAVLAAVRGLVPDLPFIIVTGSRDTEAVGRALREGADGCVEKDRLAELAPAVRRTLRQHRRCQELETECDRLRGELAAARGRPAGTEMVPICASCKSVRMAGNRWLALEEFLGREAGFRLTHSLCPGCVEKFYVA
jgi:DNA-binding NtrC family response regulator